MSEMVEKYSLLLRITHWVMAVLILGLIAIGYYMVDLPREHPDKWTYYGWHKSFGVIVLVLFIERVVARYLSAIPEKPEALSAVQWLAAKVVHALLYVCMLLVPLSGYVMSDAGGYGVKVFGVAMPSFFVEKNELIGGLAHDVHGVLPYIMLGLLVAHVAGAVMHVKLIKRIT